MNCYKQSLEDLQEHQSLCVVKVVSSYAIQVCSPWLVRVAHLGDPGPGLVFLCGLLAGDLGAEHLDVGPRVVRLVLAVDIAEDRAAAAEAVLLHCSATSMVVAGTAAGAKLRCEVAALDEGVEVGAVGGSHLGCVGVVEWIGDCDCDDGWLEDDSG